MRPALLTILAAGETHGYGIVQRLAEMPMFEDEPPNASGVYRALNQMLSEELVESEWEVSASGPAKKLYRITPAGKHCLAMWMESLTVYRNALDGLLSDGRKALGEMERSEKAAVK